MDDSRNKRRRYTRDVSCMNIDKEIGSGVYGAVFRATDRTTHKSVALKMVKMKTEKHGFPVTAMREIKILKSIKHENIISLLEILSCDEDSRNAGHGIEEGAVFMVLELMDFNLSTLIASKHMVARLMCTMYLSCAHLLMSNSRLYHMIIFGAMQSNSFLE